MPRLAPERQVRRGLPARALLPGRRRSSTTSSNWPSTAPSSSSAPSMPTSSRIQAARPTWPSTSRCSKPGDTVLGMELSQGGHLTHGSPVSFSGQFYNFVHYGVDPESERLDYDHLADLATEHKPKLIVAGASAYSAHHRLAAHPRDRRQRRRALHGRHRAHCRADRRGRASQSRASRRRRHHHDPQEPARAAWRADPVQGRTLRRRSTAPCFPASRAVRTCRPSPPRPCASARRCSPSSAAYQQQVVDNASALADGLLRGGMQLVSGGTDNHLLVVKLLDRDYSGERWRARSRRAGIITSMSTVPGETRKPAVTSGVRFGTPARDHTWCQRPRTCSASRRSSARLPRTRRMSRL